MTVIVAVGFANGAACPHTGQYLQWFDFDAFDGQGAGSFANDRKKALEFPDIGAAMKFWATVSKVRPVREDGKPNRPLTALTVKLED